MSKIYINRVVVTPQHRNEIAALDADHLRTRFPKYKDMTDSQIAADLAKNGGCPKCPDVNGEVFDDMDWSVFYPESKCIQYDAVDPMLRYGEPWVADVTCFADGDDCQFNYWPWGVFHHSQARKQYGDEAKEVTEEMFLNSVPVSRWPNPPSRNKPPRQSKELENLGWGKDPLVSDAH